MGFAPIKTSPKECGRKITRILLTLILFASTIPNSFASKIRDLDYSRCLPDQNGLCQDVNEAMQVATNSMKQALSDPYYNGIGICTGITSASTYWPYLATAWAASCINGTMVSGPGPYTRIFPSPQTSVLVKKRPVTCESESIVGNPISCASGYKIEKAVDSDFLQLIFRRGFRSGSLLIDSVSGNPLGDGWYSYLSAKVLPISDGVNGINLMFSVRPNGYAINFNWNNGAWKTDTDLAGYSLQAITDPSGDPDGWLLQTPNQVHERYDLAGNLIWLEQSGARIANFQRDNRGQVVAVTDSNGRSALFQYGENGMLSRSQLPDGSEITYTYEDYKLVSVGRSGSLTSYGYENITGIDGTFLSNIGDESGIDFAKFDYDNQGNAIRTQHALGSGVHSISYDANSLQASATSPEGFVDTFSFEEFSGSKKLVSLTRTCSGCTPLVSTRTYDQNGYLRSAKGFKGEMTSYSHDSFGQLTQKIEAPDSNGGSIRTDQTDWHPYLHVPIEQRTYDSTNTLIHKSALQYNARGQLLTFTRFNGNATRTKTTTYCEQTDIDAGTCPLPGLTTSVDGLRSDLSDLLRYTYYATDDSACAATPATCAHRKGDLQKITN
ncbi:hypothetical protein LN470_09830, partial [Xanthomonas phaseoli]|nr:hypothetical protein [Xanthomonas phaseoli]